MQETKGDPVIWERQSGPLRQRPIYHFHICNQHNTTPSINSLQYSPLGALASFPLPPDIPPCRRKSRANTTTAAAAAPLPSTRKPPSFASASAVPPPSTTFSVSKQQNPQPQSQTSKKHTANSACSPIRTRTATMAQTRLSRWLLAPLQS